MHQTLELSSVLCADFENTSYEIPCHLFLILMRYVTLTSVRHHDQSTYVVNLYRHHHRKSSYDVGTSYDEIVTYDDIETDVDVDIATYDDLSSYDDV